MHKSYFLFVVLIFIATCIFFLAPPAIFAKELLSQNYNQHKQKILTIELNIDRTNNKVNILSVKKGMGFVPDYNNPNVDDFLTVNVNTNSGTKNIMIPVPLQKVFDIPEGDKFKGGPPENLDNFKYIAIIPYEDDKLVSIEKTFIKDQKKNETVRARSAFLAPTDKRNSVIEIVQSPTGTTQETLQLSEPTSLNAVDDFELVTIFDGNPGETDPSKTLDITFVATGYTAAERQKFIDFVTNQSDFLIGFRNYSGKAPFPENNQKIKVRALWSTRTFNPEVNEVLFMLSDLAIPTDSIALINNEQFRSWAYLGGGFTYISGSEYNAASLFAHEFGHSFGSLLDEYVEGSDPNYIPFATSQIYHSQKNCKDDPEKQWLNNLPGGAYLGCSYVLNYYRPEERSIMMTMGTYDEFNDVSRYLINEAFNSYTDNKISVYMPDHRDYTKDLDATYYSSSENLYIKNLGKVGANFHYSLETEVPWIYPINQSYGTVPEGPFGVEVPIYFSIDYSKIPNRGVYETAFIMDFNNETGAKLTKRIPIKVYVGRFSDAPELTWDLPTNGTIIASDSAVHVSLSDNIEPPGWQMITYFYQTPSAQFYHSSPGGVFASRTLPSYSATFEPKISEYYDINRLYGELGTYKVWAMGIPWIGNRIETQKINIEVKASPGTLCSSFVGSSCSAVNENPKCFQGTSDCAAQGKSYCCNGVQPTVTTSPTPSGYVRGDANYDSNVDGLDYSVFINTFGGPGGEFWGDADFDDSGTVDEKDYAIWVSNYKPVSSAVLNSADVKGVNTTNFLEILTGWADQFKSLVALGAKFSFNEILERI